jgi:hypothetical protein
MLSNLIWGSATKKSAEVEDEDEDEVQERDVEEGGSGGSGDDDIEAPPVQHNRSQSQRQQVHAISDDDEEDEDSEVSRRLTAQDKGKGRAVEPPAQQVGSVYVHGCSLLNRGDTGQQLPQRFHQILADHGRSTIFATAGASNQLCRCQFIAGSLLRREGLYGIDCRREAQSERAARRYQHTNGSSSQCTNGFNAKLQL